jgi:hypothetical protein
MKVRWVLIPLAAVVVAVFSDELRRRRTAPEPSSEPSTGDDTSTGLGVVAVHTAPSGDVDSEDRSGQWADDGGGGAGGGQRPTTARIGEAG